jgi:hypothetical protein
MLTRLIYHSENHLGVKDGRMLGELNIIMKGAIRRNQANRITGALVFDRLWFLQVLEGERDVVSETVLRIANDQRHDRLTIMDARPIGERAFGNWWMGIAAMQETAARLLERQGLPPRFNPTRMTGEQALALAVDLAQQGLARELAALPVQTPAAAAQG